MFRKPLSLTTYHWPTVCVPACVLRVPFDALVDRHALAVEHWDEDGLGPARGGAYLLDSNLVVAIQDLEYARNRPGMAGPCVEVDATDLIANGIAGTVRKILDGLRLPDDAIDWMPEEAGLDAARELVRSTEEWRARKAGNSQD